MEGPYGVVVAVLWGAIWGSFFNVVIARVPDGRSVVRPPSHCMACGETIRWYDNVPFVSYLLLRGRCRACGERFSPSYLLVEAAVCLLTVAAHQVFVVDGDGPIGLRLARLVIGSLFCGAMVAVAAIDFRTMRIPNAITYPGMVLCVAVSPLMGLTHWWDGFVGAPAGLLGLELMVFAYYLISGREGMGPGDSKLLGMVGGLLGWQVLLPTLFLASLQGSIIGIPLLVIARRRAANRESTEGEDGPAATDDDDRPNPDQEPPDDQDMGPGEGDEDSIRHAAMPFGPFLALAAMEVLLLRYLWEPYLLF